MSPLMEPHGGTHGGTKTLSVLIHGTRVTRFLFINLEIYKPLFICRSFHSTLQHGKTGVCACVHVIK